MVVPADNLAEASLVDGIDVWGVRTLRQLQGWLDGSAALDPRIALVSSPRSRPRTLPTWWVSRPGSPSRWPPPGLIT